MPPLIPLAPLSRRAIEGHSSWGDHTRRCGIGSSGQAFMSHRPTHLAAVDYVWRVQYQRGQSFPTYSELLPAARLVSCLTLMRAPRDSRETDRLHENAMYTHNNTATTARTLFGEPARGSPQGSRPARWLTPRGAARRRRAQAVAVGGGSFLGSGPLHIFPEHIARPGLPVVPDQRLAAAFDKDNARALFPGEPLDVLLHQPPAPYHVRRRRRVAGVPLMSRLKVTVTHALSW